MHGLTTLAWVFFGLTLLEVGNRGWLIGITFTPLTRLFCSLGVYLELESGYCFSNPVSNSVCDYSCNKSTSSGSVHIKLCISSMTDINKPRDRWNQSAIIRTEIRFLKTIYFGKGRIHCLVCTPKFQSLCKDSLSKHCYLLTWCTRGGLQYNCYWSVDAFSP